MSTAEKEKPSINGFPIHGLSPQYVARHYYSEGLGIDDSPFPKDSRKHADYIWEIHRLQVQEFDELQGGL